MFLADDHPVIIEDIIIEEIELSKIFRAHLTGELPKKPKSSSIYFLFSSTIH